MNLVLDRPVRAAAVPAASSLRIVSLCVLLVSTTTPFQSPHVSVVEALTTTSTWQHITVPRSLNSSPWLGSTQSLLQRSTRIAATRFPHRPFTKRPPMLRAARPSSSLASSLSESLGHQSKGAAAASTQQPSGGMLRWWRSSMSFQQWARPSLSSLSSSSSTNSNGYSLMPTSVRSANINNNSSNSKASLVTTTTATTPAVSTVSTTTLTSPSYHRIWTSTLFIICAVTSVATIMWMFLPVLPAQATSTTMSNHASTLVGQTNSYLNSLTETGFYQAFSLVFLSEIGDKTFFIAGLLAMKTSRLISFIGSMGALAAMTLVSVIIGQVFHAVPSGFAAGLPLDDILAVLAFAFFGFRTLKEALEMNNEGNESTMDEELAEAEEVVKGSRTINEATIFGQVLSIFTLVFAAEFGDRSFLSTIALSAAQNPMSVAGGAIAAHAIATGIAVWGGAVVAKYISEKIIGLISGTLFLVFAVTTALGIF